MEQNPQSKVTRYHIAHLIGFAWNKAASMGVDVSALAQRVFFPWTATEFLNISYSFLIPVEL
jgi:hypothetical protein